MFYVVYGNAEGDPQRILGSGPRGTPNLQKATDRGREYFPEKGESRWPFAIQEKAQL